MDRHLTVLIVEDSESDAELVVRQLQKAGYDVNHERAETGDQMREALQRQPWDLVIADYSLPQFDAGSALAILQKLGLDIPFIVVSGTIGEDKAVTLMKAGAYDYVMKENLARLGPAVEHGIESVAEHRARRAAEQSLRESEEHYRSLFDNMLNGFAYCKMIFDRDVPTDFTYIEVNEAFGTLTGLKNVTGKNVTEVIPGIRESDPGLFDIYGRVALTGKPERFETYVASLGAWFSILAYSQRKGYFVAIFDVVTDRKRAEQALRQSLEEQTVLLKEVHHRVKNNLQIMVSLLSLQASKAENQQIVTALQDAAGRVRSMALLHEMLYGSRNLGRIDFAAYVEDLCAQLLLSFRPLGERVRIENHAAPITLSLEHGVLCGLIINELVTNSLKHAFPDGRTGTVRVELTRADNLSLRLSVRDDGVGLKADVDPASSSTLGLRLVSNLASQLEGQLIVERPDNGTAMSVIFPAPDEALAQGES